MAGDGRRPGPARPAGKPRRLPQVKTLEKAIRVLAFLASEQRECGVHEVARGVGQHPSTAYRLLAVLTRHGLVRHGSVSGRYSLGLRLAELGHAALTNLELRATARPYLEEVMAQTRETVHLMMLDGDFGIYVDRVEGPQRVRVASSVGYREYLHCSAVGKAILAHLAAERVAEIAAKGLPRLTPRTITDVERLRHHLREVASRGFALDNEEGELGIRCVGAPIFDYGGNVVAAMSVAGPAFRVSPGQLAAWAPLVTRTAARISRELGFPGHSARTEGASSRLSGAARVDRPGTHGFAETGSTRGGWTPVGRGQSGGLHAASGGGLRQRRTKRGESERGH